MKSSNPKDTEATRSYKYPRNSQVDWVPADRSDIKDASNQARRERDRRIADSTRGLTFRSDS
jgi:hypothetical protein